MKFAKGAIAGVIALVAKARNLKAPDVEKLTEYKDTK